MKIRYFLLIFFLAPSLGMARDIVDATQTHVSVVDQPQKIITLAPSLGEWVADFLEKDLNRVVGVSEYTDYPPSIQGKPSIGPYHQVNLEKIIALKPDLVLATLDGNSKDQIKHLRELGVSVVVVKTENFVQMGESMEIVSTALNVPSAGKRMASQLRAGLEKIRIRSQTHRPVPVLLQVGQAPLVVVGKQSFLHACLEWIGARNLYEDSEVHYPRPSLEDVISRNPEFIIILAMGDDLKPSEKMAAQWNQNPKLKAVQNKKVIILKSDELVRPTLRILDGLSRLEEVIYGKN